MKTFKNNRQVANHLFSEMGLKVNSVYVENGDYSEHAIYINRIANCGKPKFRVLVKNRDKVKNCIKITYNPDMWEREYLELMIKSKLKLFSHFAIGSCHQFIRHGIVKDILTGLSEMKQAEIRERYFTV